MHPSFDISCWPTPRREKVEALLAFSTNVALGPMRPTSTVQVLLVSGKLAAKTFAGRLASKFSQVVDRRPADAGWLRRHDRRPRQKRRRKVTASRMKTPRKSPSPRQRKTPRTAAA